MPSAMIDDITHDVTFRVLFPGTRDGFTYHTRCEIGFRLTNWTNLPVGVPSQNATTCMTCIGKGPLLGQGRSWHDKPPWRGE